MLMVMRSKGGVKIGQQRKKKKKEAVESELQRGVGCGNKTGGQAWIIDALHDQEEFHLVATGSVEITLKRYFPNRRGWHKVQSARQGIL